MENKTKEKNNNAEGGEVWTDFLKEWATENLKKIAMNTFGEARKKVGDFFRRVIGDASRVIISSLVILIGLVFLMVGLAILINEMLPISGGIGYIIVGVIVALIGLVVSDHRRK